MPDRFETKSETEEGAESRREEHRQNHASGRFHPECKRAEAYEIRTYGHCGKPCAAKNYGEHMKPSPTVSIDKRTTMERFSFRVSRNARIGFAQIGQFGDVRKDAAADVFDAMHEWRQAKPLYFLEVDARRPSFCRALKAPS